MNRSTTHSFLAALDRPAREALRMAGRPFWITLGFGLLGATMVAVASGTALLLDGVPPTLAGLERAGLLRALFESLLVVVPSSVVMAGYFGVRATPRAQLAAVALGLLAGGVAVMSTVPLLGYLRLVAQATPMVSPGAIVPLIALAGTVATSGRVLSALDPSSRGRRFALGFQLAVVGLFLFRALPWRGVA